MHIKLLKKLCLLVFVISLPFSGRGQVNVNSSMEGPGLFWFVAANIGAQISGIKSEDFVSSNYSPLFNITAGRWFVPYLALQFGYKGCYFNYIGDDVRHHYSFYFGEAALNVHKLFQPKKPSNRWNLVLHSGAGYFFNRVYDRPNICANMGVKQTFKLSDQWYASFDVSAIIGWDIYQRDEDILPSAAVGVIIAF